MVTDYDELRLRFERRNGSYEVFATGVGGEAAGEFSLPFSELELENIVLRLGGARRGVRRVDSPEMKLAEEFGRKLFESVFRNQVRDLYRTCATRARAGERGMRVTLCLSDTPELMHLPWEYLYDHPTFLSTRQETPVVRYLNLPSAPRPLRIDLPLRILGMVSAPRDAVALDVLQERRNLEQAVAELTHANAVEITWLEQATLLALLDKLQTGQYHVFHYIGHGGYDEQADDGMLLLEDQNGLGHRVTGRRLATILGNHVPLRLAVLNACEGARTSRTDPFAGVAASLVQQEVPAVVAMQFEITDRAAILFAGQFYKALARGYGVDAALAWARLAIFADHNDIEWGTPVLMMRAPNGRIFDVPKPLEGKGLTLEPPPEGPEPPPSPPRPPSPSPPRRPRPGRWKDRRVLVASGVAALAGVAVLAILLLAGGGSPAVADLEWDFGRVTKRTLPGRQELRGVLRLPDGARVAVGFDRAGRFTQPLVLGWTETAGWTRQTVLPPPTGGRQVLNGVAASDDAVVAVGWMVARGRPDGARDAAVWRREVRGTTWTRVCRDEEVCGDGIAESSEERQEMWAVAAREDGTFVAVGSETRRNRREFDGAVWLSSDGEMWRRAVGGPDLRGFRNQELRGVIETRARILVAVGSDRGEGAVWRSVDGEQWQLAERVECSRECAKLIFYGVAELENGDLIAVGAEELEGDRELVAIWRQPRGRGPWQQVARDLRRDDERLLAVVAGEDAVAAVGSRLQRRRAAMVWRSADGVEWRAEGSARFSGPGEREMRAVALEPDGTVVAVGNSESRAEELAADSDQQDGAVWVGQPR